MSAPLLEVQALQIAFWQRAERKAKDRPQTVVHDVSFQLRPGRVACLLGQSGSGKTVTARAIAGALVGQPGVVGGRVAHGGAHPVTLYGQAPRRADEPLNATLMRAHRMARRARRTMARLGGARPALIFQNSQTALSPFWTVRQLLSRAARQAGAADADPAATLQRVGFAEPGRFLDRYPFELSGGEAKRVAIAAALARAPALVMADEPTTGLDSPLRLAIRDQFAEIVGAGAALLLITHGIGLYADLVDDVYVMYRGRVVEQAPARALIHDAQHPYTRRLLRAELSVGSESLAPAGAAAEPAPGGCAYLPACDVHPRLSPAQQALCRAPVELVQVGEARVRCTVVARR